MTILQDTTEPFMPNPAPEPLPLLEAPLVPPVRGPRAAIERIDALDCDVLATCRIGIRLSCETHRHEVASAIWNADPRPAMFDVDEDEARERDLHCGGTYAQREAGHDHV